MKDPLLNLAIFFIWWWMAWFAVLPIGVRNIETSEAAQGQDSGAPQRPMLAKKALWAAALAAILWAVTVTVIALDPFKIRS